MTWIIILAVAIGYGIGITLGYAAHARECPRCAGPVPRTPDPGD